MDRPIKWGTIVTLGLVIITGFYLRSESWMGTTVLRPLQSDASDYFYYAFNMRYQNTYSREVNPAADSNRGPDSKYQPTPDAVRSPGYPMVLSLLIDGPPGGKLIKKIQLFQMLVSTLTLVLGFFFFRYYLPPFSGGLAALLMALSPHLIIFNSYILSETIFCFFLVLIGSLICRYSRQPSGWFSILLGSIMGIGTLVRPSLQFFPLVMVILLLIHYGPKAGLKLGLPILLGFFLTVSPWYTRNAITLGKLSDKSLMINFLHHGMYPNFKYMQKPESYGRPYKFDPRSDVISANVNSVLAEIKHRFRTEPLQHLNWFIWKKPAFFWSWDTVQGHGDAFVYYVSKTPFFEKKTFQRIHQFMRIIHGPLVIMSLMGSLLVWIVPRQLRVKENTLFIVRVVGALLLYFTILHMIGAPFPRYSVPLRPFQYGMAIFCLHIFHTSVKNRKVNI